MNINRQNYEELFLMYVDNELTAAQRNEVEVFVQQNPDLADELAMLQESVLLPEQLSFTGKEQLYKTEDSININNYETYFLLDVDNELTVTEKQEVEKFVLQHPQLQDEFTLLHNTRLQPEIVEFKNKASLYRTEEKRRVIPMNFMRLAVAASVIGLVAMLWLFYPGKNEVSSPLANNNKTEIIPAAPQPGETAEPARDAQTPAETFVEPTLTALKNNTPESKKPANSVSNTVIKTPENIVDNKEELFATVTPKQQPVKEDVYIESNNRTYTTEPTMAINASAKNIDESNASIARPALYKEVEEEEEDNSFYIGSMEINKNKVRGLLKKASNLFDKKAKSNDSEKTIRIASFEIKTK